MGLCVANYYPAKGHVRLIDCVRTMNRTDFTLVCIGKEGDHLPYLQKQAEGLPIKFVLDIPRNLTVAAYHAADIFLFGSEVEASPLVIIEAKASRTPFVSTNCGNVSEWKGGIVCAPEDMARIANHLLNNEQLRQQLVDEGWQEWKATQTWEAIVDQYERLYLGLVQHKKRGVIT
jgi:glycosyltransferase involved in cell wall biosynthesis